MKLLVAVLALVGTALAQDPVPGFDPIEAPKKTSSLKAGDTFEIKWDPAPAEHDDDKVDIVLLAGKDPGHLNAVPKPIAEGVDNTDGSFSWDIPSDLGDKATYGIRIQLSSDPDTFQYSEPFKIAVTEDDDDDGNSDDGDDDDSSGKPTKSTSADDSEETGSSTTTTKPKTTVTKTEGVDSTPTSSKPLSTTTSPGAAAHATAGVMALLGGIAVAAIGL